MSATDIRTGSSETLETIEWSCIYLVSLVTGHQGWILIITQCQLLPPHIIGIMQHAHHQLFCLEPSPSFILMVLLPLKPLTEFVPTKYNKSEHNY